MRRKAKSKPFGQVLREARIARGHSLRKFAQMVEISPTYLSLVEQNKTERPPTADRVKKMADLLGANSDEWIALAGRVPEDIPEIIQEQPSEMSELLRAARGLSAEELRKITEQVKKLKRKKVGNKRR